MEFLRLFYEFFITGLLSFGGGLSAIPFLQEMSHRTDWFTPEQLMDMIAIAEATPGPIGVNMATYAGFAAASLPGGIIATLGLIMPSMIIATIAARLLSKFKTSTVVQSAFSGLRPAAVGLMSVAGLSVLRLSLFPAGAVDIKAIVLAAFLFILVNKLKAHPIVFLAGSALVGIIFEF